MAKGTRVGMEGHFKIPSNFPGRMPLAVSLSTIDCEGASGLTLKPAAGMEL